MTTPPNDPNLPQNHVGRTPSRDEVPPRLEISARRNPNDTTTEGEIPAVSLLLNARMFILKTIHSQKRRVIDVKSLISAIP